MQPEPGTKTYNLMALTGIIIFIISFMMWWKGMLLLIGGTLLGGVATYLYEQSKDGDLDD
tara:strand:- start:943 stop:1122 length:180 start_codon:yes stop_codon:yes gene_type:complete